MKPKERKDRPGSELPPADVAVIGAGAAGLLCAMEASRRGRNVTVIERNASAGRKISVSGGGHCNFTNLKVTPEDYFSANPDFSRSALSRFRPEDFMAILDRHGVLYEERESGQMFASGPASLVTEALERECSALGVRLIADCNVLDAARTDRFRLDTGQGTLSARKLIVAAGGCARADLGASDAGLRIARKFGLAVMPPAPALSGLRWSSADLDLYGGLAGISFEARVACGRDSFNGAVLLTHVGLSGPAIMNSTLTWKEGTAIEIDLAPGAVLIPGSSRDDPPGLNRMRAPEILGRLLPARLARRLAEAWAPPAPIARWTPAERKAFEKTVHGWRITPAGTEGYEKSEVMRGGVDTRELSSKTFECGKVPGLYFAGEVLDVTGKVGGFNLHWAWASGFAAGQAV